MRTLIILSAESCKKKKHYVCVSIMICLKSPQKIMEKLTSTLLDILSFFRGGSDNIAVSISGDATCVFCRAR